MDGCLEILATEFFSAFVGIPDRLLVQLASKSCAVVPRKTFILLVNSYVYRLFCHLCEGVSSICEHGDAFGVWSVVCVRSAGSIYVKHESRGKLV
jgi:hypothetical protein